MEIEFCLVLLESGCNFFQMSFIVGNFEYKIQNLFFAGLKGISLLNLEEDPPYKVPVH